MEVTCKKVSQKHMETYWELTATTDNGEQVRYVVVKRVDGYECDYLYGYTTLALIKKALVKRAEKELKEVIS